jgi:hypothetical protein
MGKEKKIGEESDSISLPGFLSEMLNSNPTIRKTGRQKENLGAAKFH